MLKLAKLAAIAAAGLLMEKELEYLGKAVQNPERPYIAIVGGGGMGHGCARSAHHHLRIRRRSIAAPLAHQEPKTGGRPSEYRCAERGDGLGFFDGPGLAGDGGPFEPRAVPLGQGRGLGVGAVDEDAQRSLRVGGLAHRDRRAFGGRVDPDGVGGRLLRRLDGRRHGAILRAPGQRINVGSCALPPGAPGGIWARPLRPRPAGRSRQGGCPRRRAGRGPSLRRV